MRARHPRIARDESARWCVVVLQLKCFCINVLTHKDAVLILKYQRQGSHRLDTGVRREARRTTPGRRGGTGNQAEPKVILVRLRSTTATSVRYKTWGHREAAGSGYSGKHVGSRHPVTRANLPFLTPTQFARTVEHCPSCLAACARGAAVANRAVPSQLPLASQ